MDGTPPALLPVRLQTLPAAARPVLPALVAAAGD